LPICGSSVAATGGRHVRGHVLEANQITRVHFLSNVLRIEIRECEDSATKVRRSAAGGGRTIDIDTLIAISMGRTRICIDYWHPPTVGYSVCTTSFTNTTMHEVETANKSSQIVKLRQNFIPNIRIIVLSSFTDCSMTAFCVKNVEEITLDFAFAVLSKSYSKYQQK
jgi:hypothetical protein